MFRCYFCGEVTPPKTTRHSVVIGTREKEYMSRRKESRGRGGFRNRDDDVQDRGGTGVEITQEVSACPTCAAKQHEVKVTELEKKVEAPVEDQASAPAEAAPAEATSEPKAEASAEAASE